ncbi:MAG: metal-dependent hydrolase [Gemmatimonadaceae bacterium]
MITGHLGVAAAAHAARRDCSLLWLLGASMAPDVVDALFVVARSCNPNGLYSHTVPAAVLIAAVTGAAAFLATNRRATGLLAAALVLAHVPLDYVTGYKLFWPGGEIVGLRVYERPAVDFVLEAALVVAGWRMLRTSPSAPRWATGWPALAALLAVQGSLDVLGKGRGGVKPSACAQAQVSTAERRSGQ